MVGLQIPCDLEKAENLWFEDGNLIVRAQRTVFRLYKELLCMHSSFFRDKLAASNQQIDDTCSFIELDDDAQDLTCLFRAIFDTGYFEPPDTEAEFTIVSTIYRLSSKYKVNFLRRRCVMHFETSYPTTIERWCHRDRDRTIPAVDNMPFAILNLARSQGMPWLLPSVYYCLCTHPLEKIFEGVPFRDETVILGPEDIRAGAVGRARLLQLQMQYAVEVVNEGEGNSYCEDSGCRDIRSHGLQSIANWETMGYLDLVEDKTDVFRGMCERCDEWYKQFHTKTRKALWESLPEMFGLGTWETLRSSQQDILSLQTDLITH